MFPLLTLNNKEIMSKKNINHFAIKNNILSKIARQINEGGVTYGPLLDKNYGGTPNIAISPFPERSKIFKGKATERMVTNYFNRNNDLFQKGFAIGGWSDKSSNKTYLDITAPIPLEKQSEAIKLGKKANQIAGFNLSDFSEVPLGGTGEFSSLVSPYYERLEDAEMLMNN